MTEALKAISWSELKTFQRCPKQWEYKYDQRLVPKRKERPLFLGNWVHSALETFYTGGDWRIGHNEYKEEWDKLFKEEQEQLRRRGKGMMPPFPEVVERIMRSYVWYRRDENWTVKAVEQPFEVETPLIINGKMQPFQGIIDLVIEDEDGQWWIVDHKTASTIPDQNAFHATDPQLMLYPWAAKQAWGWDVAGVIYNYVKSKPPTIPEMTKKTGQISRRKINTDYPTLKRFLKENGYDPADFRDVLKPLKKQSPFLARYRLPREKRVTKEILLDSLTTAKAIRTTKRHVRVVTKDCVTMCAFHTLCRNELNGFDTTIMRKQMFTLKEESKIGDRSRTIEEDWEEDEDSEDE